jgi:hypothetical protein
MAVCGGINTLSAAGQRNSRHDRTFALGDKALQDYAVTWSR